MRTFYVKLSVKNWEIDSDFEETVDNNHNLRLIDDDSFIFLFNHVCLSGFTNWVSVSKSLFQDTILSQNLKTIQMSSN